MNAKTVSRLFRGEAVLAANVEAIAAALGLAVKAIAQLPDAEADAGYAEAKRQIREAIAAQDIVLDLSGLNLKAVPPSIGQLAHLTELYLHDNERLGLSDENLGPTRQQVIDGQAASADPKDILNYYFQLLERRSRIKA